MDQSLDESLAEYLRLEDALAHYCDRSGPNMSEPERILTDLCYYWSAAICNNGDVFGYVPFIIEHEADFIAIGAVGTLKALAKLMPFYREQEKLENQDDKNKYWWRTRDERAPVEALAEGVNDFGYLLLAYAQKNLGAQCEA